MNIELVILMIKGITKLIENESSGITCSTYSKNKYVQSTTMKLNRLSITPNAFEDMIQRSVDCSVDIDEDNEMEVSGRP